MTTNILVYGHWMGLSAPLLIGVLSAEQLRGKLSFSFEYDPLYLKSDQRFILDPDLGFFTGKQYTVNRQNFGLFLDSMPDTWGKTLMKRRAAQIAAEKKSSLRFLNEVDFLLGVNDKARMGALRFKLDPAGPFLDDDKQYPVPPWSSVKELQYAANILETSQDERELREWLMILLAPGSSLGGARPKASILDNHNHLWIAKFPSKNDITDKGLWEYLAYRLALKAGINIADSAVEKVTGNHHTYFTKRFDRDGEFRIHFASAMTMTGNDESLIRDNSPSYLEIAEFIQNNGADIKTDLAQLWRRIVFNILISNTDDHLRNHGFLLHSDGWRLSPAFDLNPSIEKNGLALNIDMDDNSLDIELAKSVGNYFRLNSNEMNEIINEVNSAVASWKKEAAEIGIPRNELLLMEPAFLNY